ncbi:MAG: hypothetical protein ABI091_12585 [Ferruginibacter sp.]
MNNIIILSLIIILSNIAEPKEQKPSDTKYFEGIISYKSDFIKKTNKFDSATIALIAGRPNTFYTKEGNLLTTIENGITTRLLYRKDQNKFYREKFNSDSVYWTRCDQPGQKILKFTKISKVEKIMGIECDELKVYYENKTVSYYYNSDTLKLNPEWHKEFTFYNQDFYSQEMKSYYLKSVVELEDFISIETATKISTQKLSDNVFKIPNKPLVEAE